jgi:hypothetical protein
VARQVARQVAWQAARTWQVGPVVLLDGGAGHGAADDGEQPGVGHAVSAADEAADDALVVRAVVGDAEQADPLGEKSGAAPRMSRTDRRVYWKEGAAGEHKGRSRKGPRVEVKEGAAGVGPRVNMTAPLIGSAI